MYQRVADFFEHGLIELGLIAAHLQLELLAEPLSEVADHAREAIENRSDRQHAHAHDVFLQLAHVTLELHQCVAQIVRRPAFERGGKLTAHRLRDHQLAH